MKQQITILLLLMSTVASAQSSFPHGAHNIVDSNYSNCVFDTAVYMPLYADPDSSMSLAVDANGKLYNKVAGGGGGSVYSVFGRTGTITAQSGDYSSFYEPLLGYTPVSLAQLNDTLLRYMPFSDSIIFYATQYGQDTTALNARAFVLAQLGNYYNKSASDARYAPISINGTVTGITAGTGLSGGTIITTGTISLPNTGTAGTYGNSVGNYVPVITTDAQGRVTNVSTYQVVSGGSGTVTDVAAGAGLTGGPITGSGTIAMVTVNATPGSYGNSTAIPVVTVNALGQITNQATVDITPAWASITGTPTTIAGYGITDPLVYTSGSYADPSWITALAWSIIGGTPTTISGYNIGLANDYFWMGNGSGVPTAVQMSGNATMTNIGVITVSTAATCTTIPNLTGDVTSVGNTTTYNNLVPVAKGGLNKSSATLYDIPYATSTTAYGAIGIGAANQVLAVNSGATGYTWSNPLSGTVTSVGLTVPSVFAVTPSSITSSGTFALAFNGGQAANEFLGTPDGSSGALGLRALVAADIPTIPYTGISGISGTSPIGYSGGAISFQSIPAASMPANTTGSSATPSGSIGYSTSGTSANTLVETNGQANVSANNVLGQWTTTTGSSPATITMTSGSAGGQIYSGSSTETYVLPAVSGLTLNFPFYFVNTGTGTIVVTSSGNNTVFTVLSGGSLNVMSNATSGTSASVWTASPGYPMVSTNTANTGVLRDGSDNFSAGTITASLTGNASTASALSPGANINGTGFTGASNITVTVPISSGVTGLATGVAAFLATPSSANLATAITDETGSGSLVFATSPTFVTPALGTPASGTLTNCTGLPLSAVTGLTWGTGLTNASGTISANLSAGVSGGQTAIGGTAAGNTLTLEGSSTTLTGNTTNPVIQLTGNTLNGSSVAQVYALINPTVTATSSAGYTALKVAAYENSKGSGTNDLFGLYAGSAGTTKEFEIDDAGNVNTGVWKGTNIAVANGGTGTGTAGIGAFNNITGYSASGATGTTSTNLVFSTSPTLITPALGTPSSGSLGSCTATTQAVANNSTSLATTAYVNLYAQPMYATATTLTPGTTVTWTPTVGTNIYTLTPAQTETINMGTIPGGCVGEEMELVILTSGTTSYTLTWGTDIHAQASTLATGTTTAKYFVMKVLVLSTSVVLQESITTAE